MGIHQEKMEQTCRIHTIMTAAPAKKPFYLLSKEYKIDKSTDSERSSASCRMMLTRLFLGRTGEFWSLIF